MEHRCCPELLDSLSDYLDGEASARLCAEIEQHMADCERCRIVVDTLRKTVSLYHSLPSEDLPAQARERLYKTLSIEGFFRPEKNP